MVLGQIYDKQTCDTMLDDTEAEDINETVGASLGTVAGAVIRMRCGGLASKGLTKNKRSRAMKTSTGARII